MSSLWRSVGFALVLLVVAASALAAQRLPLPAFTVADETATHALAVAAIDAYSDTDRDRYLNTLFRMQIVGGRYADARASIRELRELRRAADPARADSLFVQYEMFAEAKRQQAQSGLAFDAAFAKAFHDIYGRLDDQTAYQVLFSFYADVPALQTEIKATVLSLQGARDIELTIAIELLRKIQVSQVFAAIMPLTAALVSEDDAKRYIVDRDVSIETPDGAHIDAFVVRQRDSDKPQPTLFQFTIYANDDWSFADAKTMALHGYVGVVAYTRGKGRSPDAIVPYEHDGDDARAVIEWIARQPWSDGRVGMYGGSYNSFTQWAAAKRLPKALRAMATSASAAPGIDVPMQGGIFMNFLYPWLPYVLNNKSLDDASYGDQSRWSELNKRWYTTGRAYREMDAIDGAPSPLFKRWLDHPTYDAYWQGMIPYREEFAAIDIPVLTTTGYFDGAMVGAFYYFNEHLKYRADAQHTLLVGPYEHLTMQTGPAPVVQGYAIDAVAQMNLQVLRLQWFDHVFKGAAKPEVMKDRVNYQLMGANVWRHAPSLLALSTDAQRLHLVAARAAGEHALIATPPSRRRSIRQRVDFRDRSDVDYVAPDQIVSRDIDTRNALIFVGAAFAQPTEIAGLFSGLLDFKINKRDVDLSITLYERMSNGEQFQLASHMLRASQARDRSERQLLLPGKRQQIAFTSERMAGKLLAAGSKLVVVLSVIKQADLQINYGSGKDVSAETIADAGTPLCIRWFSDSWLELPLRKASGEKR